MRCIDVWKKEKGSCAGLRCDAKAEENLVWRQETDSYHKGGTAQDEGGNPEGLSEAIVIDDNAKRQRELDWIDRIKEYDALFND